MVSDCSDVRRWRWVTAAHTAVLEAAEDPLVQLNPCETNASEPRTDEEACEAEELILRAVAAAVRGTAVFGGCCVDLGEDHPVAQIEREYDEPREAEARRKAKVIVVHLLAVAIVRAVVSAGRVLAVVVVDGEHGDVQGHHVDTHAVEEEDHGVQHAVGFED